MWGTGLYARVSTNQQALAMQNRAMRGYAARRVVWFSVGSLFSGRNLRDWQQKAQMLLGLSGMSFFGLLLYEVAQLRSSALTHALHLARIFCGGMALGIFVTLCLEGSINVFKTKEVGKSGQPEPPQH